MLALGYGSPADFLPSVRLVSVGSLILHVTADPDVLTISR